MHPTLQLARPSERVLIVDDDPMVLRLMELVVRGAGFDVRLADSGDQAIELFAREPNAYAVVLMDLFMPKMNGAQALARLRQIDPTVPAVLVSGDADQISREESLALGSHEIVHKPFQPRALIAAVQSASRRRRSRLDQAKTCRQRELQLMTRADVVTAWRNATRNSESIMKPVGELIEEILMAEFA